MKASVSPRRTEEGRAVLKDMVPLKTPFVLWISTGDICNIKCEYCAHSMPKDRHYKDMVPRFLEWDTLMNIAEQTKQFPDRIKSAVFSSLGEPLLNPRLPDMIRALKDVGTIDKIEVITNGLLLTPDLSSRLISSGLDAINISIQGVDSGKYKDVCGADVDFPAFLENLRTLYENRGACKIFIKTLDSCLEEGEEEKFYAIFGELCDTIFINRTVKVFPGVDYSFIEHEDDMVNIYDQKCEHHDICSVTFYTLSIMPDGSIRPCSCIPSPFTYGNVNTTTLAEAFHGDKRRRFLKDLLIGRRHAYPVCGQCISPDQQSFESDNLDPYANELLSRF